jgi:hypothetical protein
MAGYNWKEAASSLLNLAVLGSVEDINLETFIPTFYRLSFSSILFSFPSI